MKYIRNLSSNQEILLLKELLNHNKDVLYPYFKIKINIRKN